MKQCISNTPVGGNDKTDQIDDKYVYIIYRKHGCLKITNYPLDVKGVYRKCLFRNNVCVEIS